jgi:hypothetical protein
MFTKLSLLLVFKKSQKIVENAKIQLYPHTAHLGISSKCHFCCGTLTQKRLGKIRLFRGHVVNVINEIHQNNNKTQK